MRRLVTWLLPAALVVLVIAAVVEAVAGRDDEEEPNRPATTAASGAGEVRDEAAAALRELGIRGTLLVADERCFVGEVRLPSLDRTPGRPRPGCSFVASPGGAVGVDGEAIAPHGETRARCDGRVVEVLRRGGAEVLAAYLGCAPAWRSDGRLTLVRDGGLWLPAVCPAAAARDDCATPILTAARLREELRQVGQPGGSPAIEQVVWLEDRNLAAVTTIQGPRGRSDFLALFRDGRLVGRPVGPFENLTGLRSSPRGTFVAAVEHEPENRIVVIARNGRVVLESSGANAVSWSPDERWVAVARWNELEISDRLDPRTNVTVTLPIGAVDLAWRP